jgi:TonB family protein
MKPCVLLVILIGLGGGCLVVFSQNRCEQERRKSGIGFRVDDTQEFIKFKPEARYTASARKHRITGTVLLFAFFHSSGTVKDVCVVSGLPYGLTRKAIAATYRIKFNPIVKNGRRTSVWRAVGYNFNLY